MEEKFKEVYFDQYCEKCAHFNEKNEDPELTENESCHECLNEPARLYSHKPLNFEEA